MMEEGDRLLTLAGVPPEKMEECLRWAFGEVHPSDDLNELRKKWNSKHKDIFVVSLRDNPKTFIWSIGKAYMVHNFSSKIILPSSFSRN